MKTFEQYLTFCRFAYYTLMKSLASISNGGLEADRDRLAQDASGFVTLVEAFSFPVCNLK